MLIIEYNVHTITDCSGDETPDTNNTGTITSPGYPDTFYSNNLDCKWIIKLEQGKYPKFTISAMFLASSEEACTDDQDYVKVSRLHCLVLS